VREARLCIRQAQHAAQQLLQVARGAHVLDCAEHIGKRAVPPFLECLDRDHVFDRAGPIEQIHAFQLALVAGCHRDPARLDVQYVLQMCTQYIDRDLAILRIGL
jgi:hypothetical protein